MSLRRSLAALLAAGCAIAAGGCAGFDERPRLAFEQRAAVFAVRDMAPGQAETRCLSAANTGTSAALRAGLWITSSGALAAALDLEIVGGTLAGSGPGGAGCAGFQASGAPLYRGPLGGAPGTAGAALVDPSGSWAPGTRRAYRVRVTLTDRANLPGAAATLDVVLAAEPAPGGPAPPATCSRLLPGPRVVRVRHLAPGVDGRLVVGLRRGALSLAARLEGASRPGLRHVLFSAAGRSKHDASRPFAVLLGAGAVRPKTIAVRAVFQVSGRPALRMRGVVTVARTPGGACALR